MGTARNIWEMIEALSKEEGSDVAVGMQWEGNYLSIKGARRDCIDLS
jgi:hypothetical protein